MMVKGQSIIIQFLLFFLIGFSIFISIGSFFKYQADNFKQSIISSGVNLTNSYLSSAVIAIVDSCKTCDFVRLTVRMQNTTAGYPIEIAMIGSNLQTSIPFEKISLISSIHNLNYSLIASGASSSAKPIVLTFNRTNNYLGVE